MRDGSSTENVDEIYEAVRQALAALEGGQLAAISYLTGLSIDKLIELGGVYEAPATETGGNRPGLPGQGPGPADAAGDRP